LYAALLKKSVIISYYVHEKPYQYCGNYGRYIIATHIRSCLILRQKHFEKSGHSY
jgi:hypothetical protein